VGPPRGIDGEHERLLRIDRRFVLATRSCGTCAAMKRRIGHRGSQTETMRDMIPLHQPLTQPSVFGNVRDARAIASL